MEPTLGTMEVTLSLCLEKRNQDKVGWAPIHVGAQHTLMFIWFYDYPFNMILECY